jgi:hypothetical protein
MAVATARRCAAVGRRVRAAGLALDFAAVFLTAGFVLV